jgi:hypothetical protein
MIDVGEGLGDCEGSGDGESSPSINASISASITGLRRESPDIIHPTHQRAHVSGLKSG